MNKRALFGKETSERKMIKNKKGQFYLIAAIAIILIILGLATVQNNLKKEGTDNTKIYELFAEVNIDDTKILNYPGTVSSGISGYTEAELENIFDKMTETYPIVEKIYFIINKNGIPKIYVYDKNSDDGSKITELYQEQLIYLNNIEIEEENYNFAMSTNSYSLIIIEKKDQQYVIKA